MVDKKLHGKHKRSTENTKQTKFVLRGCKKINNHKRYNRSIRCLYDLCINIKHNINKYKIFMVEPLLSGIVLGLVPVTLAGLFVTAYLQYRRGDRVTSSL